MNNQGVVQTGSTLNKFFAKIYAFLALGIVASAVTTIVLVNFFTESRYYIQMACIWVCV
jgi:FtsH-binding integral membrane protein